MTELTQAQAVEKLSGIFSELSLARPMKTERYEPGTRLVYDVRAVWPDAAGRVELVVDKFVGGGFAGQVYRVRIESIESDQPLGELTVGGLYAMKILRPPSRLAEIFRDAVYAVGFQGPFTISVNPAAARAGALWQKFIRAAAAERFGTPRAVTDIHATFVDTTIGACGEISEWIEGRTWRYEVDDHLESRRRWRPGQDDTDLGSPEYRSKKAFMDGIVEMLHEMGAPELARQYQWWTCKSQPNCLKRTDSEENPRAGLTAVDFRAGLALLPFLPMSPGDVPLIVKGLLRGSLVQFDRPNLAKLDRFVAAHPETFEGMAGALEQLKENERIYRDSMPDITHNHIRLLSSGRLWKTMIDSAAEGYRVRGLADEKTAGLLKNSRLATLGFTLICVVSLWALLGGAAVLAVGGATWLVRAVGWLAAGWAQPAWPLEASLTAVAGIAAGGGLLGRWLRDMLGRGDLRSHWLKLLNPLYLLRALRGRTIERLVGWMRAGRITPDRAVRLAGQPVRALLHIPLSILPIFLHRLLTDATYAKDLAAFIFVRPLRLYFNAEAREQWLREMVEDGRKRHILDDADAEAILSQIKEPFIQKYLKALAVHVLTLPVSQMVAIAIAIWIGVQRGLNWSEIVALSGASLAVVAVVPISPGSFVRGLYVVYLVIRERNFKDYNIAVFLGFFKYVGYLAFPIQMAYRYPALARFMAAHWATGAVNIVPVFGERGALLEHWAFDGFYNYPLTVRRRIRQRSELRQGSRAQWVMIGAIVLLAAGAMVAAAVGLWQLAGRYGTLETLWPAVVVTPLIVGVLTGLLAGPISAGRRMALAAGVGAAVGVLNGLALAVLTVWLWAADVQEALPEEATFTGHLVGQVAWSFFLFALLGLAGAAIVETRPLRSVKTSAVPAGESAGK
ncbi:MAG: hypothetical protein ACLFUJ_05555 [Phycisphaerae bacterium]